MFARLVRVMNQFFSNWQKAGRPTWEFRVRYAPERSCWLIELNEGQNGETWVPLTKRTEDTENEPIVQKFGSWNEARTEAYRLGLQYSYEEVHYSSYHHIGKDTRPAPEVEVAPVAETLGSVASRPHIVRPRPAR